MSRPKKGVVNHPPHYQGRTPLTVVDTEDGTEFEVPIEVADVIEHFEPENSHRAHTLTYVLRAGRKRHPLMTLKQSRIEDLKKARWWIEREIDWLGGTVNDDD